MLNQARSKQNLLESWQNENLRYNNTNMTFISKAWSFYKPTVSNSSIKAFRVRFKKVTTIVFEY